MEEKKSLGKELQEKLTFTQPHIADEQPGITHQTALQHTV